MRSLAFVCFVALILGCDPEGEPAPECGATAAEALSEGGRGFVRLELQGANGARLIDAPAALGAELVDEPLSLQARPVYGAAGTHDVTLALSCGEQEREVTVPVEVRALGWERLASWQPSESGPPAREYGVMWLDAEDPDRLLVFGGFHYVPQQFTPANDLWELDLETGEWRELEVEGPVPPMAGMAVAPLPGERSALLYGGMHQDGDGDFALPPSVWRVDYGERPVRFTSLSVGAQGVYQPAFVYDAPRARYVSACGQGAVGTHCDARGLDLAGNGVSLLTTEGGPPAGRSGFFWGHDEEGERLLVFGGDRGGGDWSCNCAQDTWALELADDPPRWVRLSSGEEPALGRRNGAYAIDPVGQRLFTWGGTNDGATTFPGLYSLSLERGEERWELVEVGGDAQPQIRSSGLAVYDAARHRLIVGFGNGDSGVHTDLWALSL